MNYEDKNVKECIVKAIEDNQLFFALQRILNLKNENEKKYEVLARLRLKGGLVNPEKLVEILKEYGKYDLLTTKLIDGVFPYIYKNQDIDEFSINFNILDIENPNTINVLKKKIKKYDLRGKVVIELTEDENLTKNLERTIATLNDLKENYECKIALDDFGKGYATFDPLMNLPFDYIKLDAVLTKDFLQDQKKFYIINLLSEYAKRMNLSIVAEYIEKKEELQAIEHMNIEYGQGYFIDKPILIENML